MDTARGRFTIPIAFAILIAEFGSAFTKFTISSCPFSQFSTKEVVRSEIEEDHVVYMEIPDSHPVSKEFIELRNKGKGYYRLEAC